MTEPPYFWRGAEAYADFVTWQSKEQERRDQAAIVAASCPVVDATGEEG